MSVAIASVILLSITLAVALAVSAWVGVISVNSMETESMWVSDISYQGTSGAADNQIVLTIINSGSYSITIRKAKVEGNNIDLITDDLGLTINAGESQVLTLNNTGWISGSKYQFEFLSARGNIFPTTDRA